MASRVWLLSEWATVQRENGHDCFRPWMPAFAWSPMLVSARCQFMKAGDPGVGAGQWIEGIINGMSLWWCTSGGQWLARRVVFPHKGETSLRREAVNLGIRCVEQQGHLAPGATSYARCARWSDGAQVSRGSCLRDRGAGVQSRQQF